MQDLMTQSYKKKKKETIYLKTGKFFGVLPEAYAPFDPIVDSVNFF